jgi:hypothetical protein
MKPFLFRSFRTLPYVLLALLAVPAHPQGGVGDLTVTPTRLVFEGRTRSQSISLIHRGAETATYRIETVEQRMTEDGRFEPIAEPRPDERLASGLVRYSPRRVTLTPGVAQTIRLALRKPADLEPGEYRSHLALYAEPPEDAGASVEEPAEGDELGLRLIPIYRITVPLIVRHGTLDATARLELADPVPGEDGAPLLPLAIRRSGTRSLFGDLEVTLEPEDGGEPRVVAQVRGLAVYTPNAARTLELPLRPPEGTELAGGRLQVTFHEPDRADGAHAEASLETRGSGR